jgi:hypothetical protein
VDNNYNQSYTSAPSYRDYQFEKNREDGLVSILVILGLFAIPFSFIIIEALYLIIKKKILFVLNNFRFDLLASFNNTDWLLNFDSYSYYNGESKVELRKVENREMVIIEFKAVPFDCIFRYNKNWWKKTSNLGAIKVSEELVRIPMDDKSSVAVFTKNIKNVKIESSLKFKV